MFIVMGKKLVRRRLGRVADFCPICRGLSCMRAARVSEALHLYYVPVSSGKILTHEFQCEECGAVLNGSHAPFAGFSRSRTRDVVELAMETNPELVERRRERLEVEDRIDAGKLSGEERRALLTEPFLALNYMTQSGAAASIPTPSGLAIIGLVFLAPITGIVLAHPNADLRAKVILPAICAALLGIIAFDIRRGAFNGVRRKMHPLLVRALLPLHPERREIEEVLLSLRRERLPIGKRVKADALMRDLATANGALPN
jgi:hypothetical protein